MSSHIMSVDGLLQFLNWIPCHIFCVGFSNCCCDISINTITHSIAEKKRSSTEEF